MQKQRSTGRCTKKGSYILTGILRCPDCGRVFRRQTVRGVPYWICSGRASGTNDCRKLRVQENEVYSSFTIMVMKLIDNRNYIIGSLIKQIEEMQYRTNGNQQRIKEIDKEIADLSAQNLLLARLHTKGILNSSDYTGQSDDISNKITELRIERRRKLSEDEDDELLDELKSLDSILKDTENDCNFDNGLFEQIVKGIIVKSNAELTFKLLGDIELTEEIYEKGRCKSV